MKTEYLELITQLKTYISQEYETGTWIEVGRENYLDLRNWYAASQTKASIPPTPKQTEIRQAEVMAKPVIPMKPLEFKKPEFRKPVEPPKPLEKRVIEVEPEKEQAIEKQDYSDLVKIIREKFPNQILLDHPPTDEKAIAIKTKWKNETPKVDLYILVNDVQEHQKEFIENVCKAVQNVLNKQALIVYQTIQLDDKCQKIEILDIDMYLREPQHKKALWQSIKDILN